MEIFNNPLFITFNIACISAGFAIRGVSGAIGGLAIASGVSASFIMMFGRF